MAPSRKRPSWKRSVGSDFESCLTVAERTDSRVMANCRPMSSTNAVTPSTSATVSDRRTVASVEPSATVTTKSKAFIFDKVRLPETRKSTTKAR